MSQELLIPNLISGYRIFKIIKGKDPQLGSLYIKDTWQPGVNKATCQASNHWISKPSCPEEKIPASGCGCGLQAYYFLGDKHFIRPSFFKRFAIGLVFGGGRVELHHDGWRAEKAIVGGLLIPGWIKNKELIYYTQEIANRYQVPIFNSREEAARAAKKYSVSITELQIGQQSIREKRGLNLMTEIASFGFKRDHHLIYDFYSQDNRAKKTFNCELDREKDLDCQPEDNKFREELIKISNNSLKNWQKKLLIKLRVGQWRKAVGLAVIGLTTGLCFLFSMLLKSHYLLLIILPFTLAASLGLIITIVESVERWADQKIKKEALKKRGV